MPAPGFTVRHHSTKAAPHLREGGSMSQESRDRTPGWTAEACLPRPERHYRGATEFAAAPASQTVSPQMICRERRDGWLECQTKSGRWVIWTGMA
jgi:hypothetical protein